MRKKIVLLLATGLLLVLVIVGGAAVWASQQLTPVSSTTAATERFVIPRGQSFAATAVALQEAGLIRNAQVLRLYARWKQLDTKLQAGSYELAPSMDAARIANALTAGSEDTWITLLEGWRTEEVAEYLSAQELGSFDAAAFLELAENSEGMIFPDTYLVPRESTAEQLYELFTATFERKVLTGLADEIAASDLPLEDIVIHASLVEREGRGLEDKRRIAGILQRRVELGWALNVDATLQYIRGYDAATESWWSPPSITFKESTSLYNTYKYPGLPPGPIANAGLQAFQAVLDPIVTDDLFYIHAPSGEAYYAPTLEEHNANVDRYLR